MYQNIQTIIYSVYPITLKYEIDYNDSVTILKLELRYKSLVSLVWYNPGFHLRCRGYFMMLTSGDKCIPNFPFTSS